MAVYRFASAQADKEAGGGGLPGSWPLESSMSSASLSLLFIRQRGF